MSKCSECAAQALEATPDFLHTVTGNMRNKHQQ